MAADFDPYYKWLGISPDERIPTHYRLLGLIAFESDPEVIEAAADRVMSYLQEVSTGAEMARAQKLLDEVSRARLCLLNTEKKAAYDEKLRARLAAIRADETLRSGAASSEAASEQHVEGPPFPIENDLSDKLPPRKSAGDRSHTLSPTAVAQTRPREKAGDPNVRSRRFLVVAGSSGILLLLFVIGFLFRMISEETEDEQALGPVSVANREARSGFSQTDTQGARVQPIPEIPPDPASPSGAAKDDPNKERDLNERENAESPITVEEPLEKEGEKSNESDPVKTDEAEESLETGKKDVQETENVSLPDEPAGFTFSPFSVSKLGFKTSKRSFQSQGDGFYKAVGETTSTRYYLVAKSDNPKISGFWLQVKPDSSTSGVEATGPVVVSYIKTPQSTRSLQAVCFSTDFPLGKPSIEMDETGGLDWKIDFSSGDDVWAVFKFDAPLDPSTSKKLRIELGHEDASQTIPQFRVWAINGSGTIEEMAGAVRDRLFAKVPFAQLTPEPLPGGRSGEVSLGSVFLRGTPPLEVQLLGGRSSGAEGEFFLRPEAGEEGAENRVWDLCVRLPAGGSETPLAQLRLEEGQLSLAWLEAALDSPDADFLQNCLLVLSVGQKSESIPLRSAAERVPLSLNLMRTRNKLAISDVPAVQDPASLRLVLQFPSGVVATFDPSRQLDLAENTSSALLGSYESIKIEFEMDWRSPNIELTAQSKWQPEGDKWKLLSAKKVLKDLPGKVAMIKKWEDASKVLGRIHYLRNRSKTTQRKYREEIAELIAKYRTYRLPQKISNTQLENTIQKVDETIVNLKKDATHLENVERIVKQFSGDTGIEYRVYMHTDGEQVDLIRSTGWNDD